MQRQSSHRPKVEGAFAATHGQDDGVRKTGGPTSDPPTPGCRRGMESCRISGEGELKVTEFHIVCRTFASAVQSALDDTR